MLMSLLGASVRCNVWGGNHGGTKSSGVGLCAAQIVCPRGDLNHLHRRSWLSVNRAEIAEWPAV